MFKICNDKTYYVVQTTSEDVVVEIYTKKDGRGSGISLHEMHLDLCRAIRKLQHDGYTIMKVYPAMGDRRESIDVLITATDKDGKRFNKKTSAAVKVGDTVYRERYVSAIFECTCDTSDGQSARTHLGHTYKKTGMVRAPFKVVAIDT